MRQLSLSYGVEADFAMVDITSSEPLRNSLCKLIISHEFKDEDLIIVLGGSFGPAHGASYIEISTAASLRDRCKGELSMFQGTL